MVQIKLTVVNEAKPVGGLIIDGHIYRGDTGEEIEKKDIVSIQQLPWTSLSKEILGD